MGRFWGEMSEVLVSTGTGTFQWEQINAKNGPSARSGHRMAHVRDTLVVFGGFFDNLRDVKYCASAMRQSLTPPRSRLA